VEAFLSTHGWVALLTLTFLEVVLGIDNIIFISIITNKLPEALRPRARFVGLFLAMGMRIALLLCIAWIIHFKTPLFTAIGQEFSGRDLILISGGLFLIAKSTIEIGHKMEGGIREARKAPALPSLGSAIAQIGLLDIVFSFDSILTAIGLTDKLPIMITAIIVSILIMMSFSGSISSFINRYPSLQILALGFLILIGFMLVLDGLDYHVPKAYIYFAVAFSVAIEMINIRLKKVADPVQLHRRVE
jgi:predicted tellurium resistance membrane protein TerC